MTDGLNGWVFDHRSANAAIELANAVRNAIINKDALDVVRDNALRTAKEFSLSNIADSYLSDFEEVVNK